MRLVLLSGGSGKRLWPLSNDARSKQFLRILEDEKGNFQSMVQRVCNQLSEVGLLDSTIIATSKSQVEVLNSQLNNSLPLVVEPERRDTFPAIVLSVIYLYSVLGVNGNETVGILPVDPFVDKAFFEKVKELELILEHNESDIALMGVKPSFPSEKYGYIVPEKVLSDGKYKVSGFFEKPNKDKANELINNGALWNCGVFAFKISYLIDLLKEKGIPIDYEYLLENYNELNKISFDFEVLEKTNNIITLEYDGYWKDLGTWNTLTEEMGSSKIGKGLISEDSKNVHLINELDIPVTVVGISDAVVAVSSDGILISDKEKSPTIKDLVAEFDGRPMYEERRWGWYRILDFVRYDNNEEVLTKKIRIKAGANLSYQYHELRKETWTIIKGEGIIALNGELKAINAGDVFEINAGIRHAIKAIGDLEIIEVQRGTQLVEEDIVRLYQSWKDVELNCKNIHNVQV